MFRSRKSFPEKSFGAFQMFCVVSDDRDYPCQLRFPTYVGHRSGVSWQLILTVYIETLKGTKFSFLILIFDTWR